MKLLSSRVTEMNSKKGSALIIVLLALLLVSVFGMTILTVTASNFKLSSSERQFQSVYYTAEAGLTYKLDNVKNEIQSAYSSTVDAASFFNLLESRILPSTSINSFENNFGQNPRADISVRSQLVSGSSRKYFLTAAGVIGSKKRTVEREMLIEWVAQRSPVPEAFVYGSSFSFQGNVVNGSGSSVISSGPLNGSNFNGGAFAGVSNVYIDGSFDIASGTKIGSETNPGSIYVNGDLTIDGGAKLYGDVYVAGNLISKNGSIEKGKVYVNRNLNISGGGKIYGDVYIAGDLNSTSGLIERGNVYVQGDGNLLGGTIQGNAYITGNTKIISARLESKIYTGGNLTLDWTPSGNFTVDYVGTLTKPNYYSSDILSRCKKVPSVPSVPSVPTFEIPKYNITLKDNNWYTSRGYSLYNGSLSLQVIPDNFKVVVENNFTSSDWTSPSGNIIVISKHGNIDISRDPRNLTGVLIAPEGKVRFNGASFTGVVLTKSGFDFYNGGSILTSKKLSDFFTNTEMPVELTAGVAGGGGGVTANDLIKTISPAREK
jgi:hypothetical protein